MNGQVSRLHDLKSIVIPDEMLQTHVDAQSVEEKVQSLSVSCAKAVDVPVAEPGDVVHCAADSASYPDGRTVLLFTGTALPGAEEAAKAAIGKKVGDVLAVDLNGKSAELTIQRIVHRVPVAVDDALVASLGIEGVTTLEGYRAHVAQQMLADQQMENKKKITRYLLDTMIANSTFDYDEAEMDADIQANMEATLAEYAAEGLEVTPEEIRENAILQAKQIWVAEALCKEYGVSVDSAAINEQVDQMMELMSLMGEEVPDREELVASFSEGEFMNGMFTVIDQVILARMEGNHGSN